MRYRHINDIITINIDNTRVYRMIFHVISSNRYSKQAHRRRHQAHRQERDCIVPPSAKYIQIFIYVSLCIHEYTCGVLRWQYAQQRNCWRTNNDEQTKKYNSSSNSSSRSSEAREDSCYFKSVRCSAFCGSTSVPVALD